MVQIIPPKQLSGFGQLAKGFADGANTSLSQNLPKYIEHGLLTQGLKKFQNEYQGKSPMEQFSQLSSIYGISPQMLQTFGELARQQMKSRALPNGQNPQVQNTTFPSPQETPTQDSSRVPSITKETPLEEIQKGYIPPTEQEVIDEAGKLYNSNPALYEYNPNKAIEAAERKFEREEKRNAAQSQFHQKLSDIQDNVVERLNDYSKKLGVNIPANIYSKVEDQAIQATKPKSEGGKGLTEQQAMKIYGKELDNISRDYSKINTIGDWGIITRKPSETLRSLKEIQSSFEKRGDTENLADKLISSKFSPKFSYSIAEKISRVPELNNFIRNIPELEKVETLFESKVPPDVSTPKTLQIAPKLAEILKNNEKASPLAIAYELEKKGYDPDAWMQYLTDHRKELNLKENQIRQLEIPNNLIGTWNDWWLSSWSGLE